MATFVPASELKEHLQALLDRVEEGENILILREGRASAMLTSVPLAMAEGIEPAPKGPRKFGDNFLGISYIAPDFYDDLPLETFDVFKPDAK